MCIGLLHIRDNVNVNCDRLTEIHCRASSFSPLPLLGILYPFKDQFVIPNYPVRFAWGRNNRDKPPSLRSFLVNELVVVFRWLLTKKTLHVNANELVLILVLQFRILER